MIRIYAVRYRCHVTGDVVWWPESLTKKKAFAVSEELARLGRKPVIIRVLVSASDLVSCGRSEKVKFRV